MHYLRQKNCSRFENLRSIYKGFLIIIYSSIFGCSIQGGEIRGWEPIKEMYLNSEKRNSDFIIKFSPDKIANIKLFNGPLPLPKIGSGIGYVPRRMQYGIGREGRDNLWQNYAKMKNCCANAADINFEQFPNQEMWSFNVGYYDNAIMFNTGLSPIKAFELPRSDRNYTLSIISHMVTNRISGQCFEDCSYIYIPIIIFFDSQYRMIYKLLPTDLKMVTTAQRAKTVRRGYAYKVMIEKNSPAKYMIIMTTKNLIENGVEYPFSQGGSIVGSPFGYFSIYLEKM